MPELPEVESIRRVIEPQIQGLRVAEVTVAREEVVAHPSAREFCERLVGQSVAGMARRGKFLYILMESGDRLLLHLRMTGCLLPVPASYAGEKHTHVVIHLSNGTELRFSDMRRFGRFWLLGRDEIDVYSGVEHLGLEPFDRELTAAYLKQRLSHRKKAIKECLMEQSIVAGIGNIYSDEILFASGIHPARPANCLTDGEWERLASTIPECLADFTEKNAISPEDYLKGRGRDYRNTPFLQVYGRGGKPCPRCRSTLCGRRISGRSSVYCPVCQKE